MASSRDSLTPLQRSLLETFFRAEHRFFLTGGAALAGFYLQHRPTLDLDLFTLDPEAFEAGRRALESSAAELGALLTVRQHTPGFQRFIVTRGQESVVVDLVLERVPQVAGPKRLVGSVAVDPIEEIFANKLTTVLSRAEERDLVDLLLMERAGLRLEDAMAGAHAKDGGCTAAALAYVLTDVSIPDGASLPAGVSPLELRAYVSELIVRLRRMAFPTGPNP